MRKNRRQIRTQWLRRNLRLESLELRQMMDADAMDWMAEEAEPMPAEEASEVVFEESFGETGEWTPTEESTESMPAEEFVETYLWPDCYYTNDCPDPYAYEEYTYEEFADPTWYDDSSDPWLYSDCYYTNDCPDPVYDEYAYDEFTSEEYVEPVWMEDSGDPMMYFMATAELTEFDETSVEFKDADPTLYYITGDVVEFGDDEQPTLFYADGEPVQYADDGQPVLELENDSDGDSTLFDADGNPIYYRDPSTIRFFTTAAGGLTDRADGDDSDVATDSSFPRFESAEDLEQYLVADALKRYESLFGTEAWNYWYSRLDGPDMVFLNDAAVGGNAADRVTSDTNVQVQGVNEADMIETDGEFIYVIADGKLTIVDVHNPAAMSIASETTLAGYSEQMYLFGDRLAVISNHYGYAFPYLADSLVARPGFGGPPKSHVTIYDVADRHSPRVLTDVVIEGSVVDSRSIDGQIYLVTQSEFSLPQPTTHCDDSGGNGGTGAIPLPDIRLIELAEGETEGDFEPIQSWLTVDPTLFDPTQFDPDSISFSATSLIDGDGFPISDRRFWPGPGGSHCTYVTRDEYLAEISGKELDLALPNFESFDADGNLIATGLLNEATSIYRPLQRDAYSLNSVTTIAMTGDNPGVVTSTSAPLNYGSEIHVSSENLYFITTNWTDGGTATGIYQFDLDNGAGQTELVAAGEVHGRILNQFSADEFDGTFRIVTQDGWSNDAASNLFVLEQDGEQLNVIGSIEDIAPAERLYSVRFIGDRAFVVTFGPEGGVWMDPLFTINLSDPTVPTIEGELEIPGFSNYLQLIGNGYLVGLGRNADATNGRELEPQISLYDVSDFSDPQLADRLSINSGSWAWSEAFGDHHAISYFADLGLLAVPFTVQNPANQETRDGVWVPPTSALWLFHLNTDNGTIEPAGQIQHSSDVRRSVRIDDVLYSLSYKELKAHSLSDIGTQLGSRYLAPTAIDDWFTVATDSDEQDLNVLNNDDLASETAGLPVIVGVSDSAFGATVSISDDGRTILYTPAAGFFGDDSFTYTIDNGSRGIDEARVNVHVELTVEEESGSNELNVLSSVDLTGFTSPTIIDAEVSDGEVQISDDGQRLIYTPAPNFFGWVQVTFTVAEEGGVNADGEDAPIDEEMPIDDEALEFIAFSSIGDGVDDSNGDGTRTFTLSIRVRDIDDPATAADDQFTFDYLADEYNLYVTGNDSPGADENDWLTITAVTQPESGGAVAIAPWGNQILFRPTRPFDAPVSFTYTVTDQHGSSATATVTVAYAPDATGRQMADLARADLSRRLNIPAEEIDVESIRAVDWPDSCLGSPNLDQICLQVITPGFRIVLTAGDRAYFYHTDRNETVLPIDRQRIEPKARFRFEAIDENGRVVREIPAGEPFQLKVYVQDVRPAGRGLQRAFLDVLYRSSVVAPFDRDEVGNESDGLIDELGEVLDNGDWTEDREQLLASLRFVAQRPGDASFVATPADMLGNEMLVDANNESIDWEQVAIDASAFRVTKGWRNVDRPSDINEDGQRTASDVIILVNEVNEKGVYELPRGADAIAAATLSGHFYLDPNGDFILSASDCLYVINEINGLVYESDGGRFAPDLVGGGGLPLSSLVNWLAVERGLRSLNELDEFNVPVSEAIDSAFEVLSGVNSNTLAAGLSDEWLGFFKPQVVTALLNSPWLADGELSTNDIAEIGDLFDRVVDHLELDVILENIAEPSEIDDAVQHLRDELFNLLADADLLTLLEV